MIKKKEAGKSWGGARPGSGRKPAPPGHERIKTNMKLPKWAADWLATETRRTGTPKGLLIAQAISKAHKIKPPKIPQKG